MYLPTYDKPEAEPACTTWIHGIFGTTTEREDMEHGMSLVKYKCRYCRKIKSCFISGSIRCAVTKEGGIDWGYTKQNDK